MTPSPSFFYSTGHLSNRSLPYFTKCTFKLWNLIFVESTTHPSYLATKYKLILNNSVIQNLFLFAKCITHFNAILLKITLSWNNYKKREEEGKKRLKEKHFTESLQPTQKTFVNHSVHRPEASKCCFALKCTADSITTRISSGAEFL